jgi:formamidopyrimidine-DNA glycosylase
MPELPEVETIARGLRPVVEGAAIAGIDICRPDYVRCLPPSTVADLAGRRISRVGRHGKRLILELSPPGEIVFHFGMSGRLLVAGARDRIEPHTHLRLRLRGRRRELRVSDPRRFGAVWIRSRPNGTGMAASGPPPLGPDALAVRLPAFRNLLERPRQIKALLLDQRAIAGLGNIYCDEALFTARIHPATRAARLEEDETRRLLLVLQRILRTAIRHGGSTLRDYRDVRGRPGAFQRHHRVYGRTGQPCPRCGAAIVRLIVAGRSSHVCPRCQTE